MLSKADNRTRTDDLRITNALLYQLSHIGVYLSVLDYYTQFPAECKRKIYFLLQVSLALRKQGFGWANPNPIDFRIFSYVSYLLCQFSIVFKENFELV